MAAITTSPGTLPASHKSLFDSIAGLFENPKFSDFNIKCDGQAWNVHQNIVGAQSDVFEKACTGQFEEALNGVTDLPDDNKGIVNEMLRYLYTADYQDEHTAGHHCFTHMLLSVHIHTIADKYNTPALAQLATAKFAARAIDEWNTEDFANSIDEIYATAPHSKKDMHTCAVDTAVKHAKELYEDETGCRFREVAGMTPGFTSAFAAQLVSEQGESGQNNDQSQVYCTYCMPPLRSKKGGSRKNRNGFCHSCGETCNYT